MASITAGLICSPGALPAERTWIRPSERSLTRPAAIWLRPALWTQTNRTSGCSFVITPSAWPSALRRSRAKRCTSTGTKTLIVAAGEKVGRLDDVAGDRLLREDAVELALQRLGRTLHVLARDRIENLHAALLHDRLLGYR